MHDLFNFPVLEDPSHSSWVLRMLEKKEYFLGIQEDQTSNPASSSSLEDLGK